MGGFCAALAVVFACEAAILAATDRQVGWGYMLRQAVIFGAIGTGQWLLAKRGRA